MSSSHELIDLEAEAEAAEPNCSLSDLNCSLLASADLAMILSCLLAFVLLAIAISVAFTFGLRSAVGGVHTTKYPMLHSNHHLSGGGVGAIAKDEIKVDLSCETRHPPKVGSNGSNGGGNERKDGAAPAPRTRPSKTSESYVRWNNTSARRLVGDAGGGGGAPTDCTTQSSLVYLSRNQSGHAPPPTAPRSNAEMKPDGDRRCEGLKTRGEVSTCITGLSIYLSSV